MQLTTQPSQLRFLFDLAPMAIIVISHLVAIASFIFITLGFPAFTSYINQQSLSEKPKGLLIHSLAFPLEYSSKQAKGQVWLY